MKYLFTTFSPFFYAAVLFGATWLLMDRQELSFMIDYEFYTLADRRGLGMSALLFGFIWLIYIGQSQFLYSKSLIRLHFISTFLIVSAMCWYHSQGFEGRMVSLGPNTSSRGGTMTYEAAYHVLPYTWLLALLFLLAQGVFIIHAWKGRTSRY